MYNKNPPTQPTGKNLWFLAFQKPQLFTFPKVKTESIGEVEKIGLTKRDHSSRSTNFSLAKLQSIAHPFMQNRYVKKSA